MVCITVILEVSYVSVNHLTGSVNVEDLFEKIRETTCFITIMLANNETGVIQVCFNKNTTIIYFNCYFTQYKKNLQPIEEIGEKLEILNKNRALKIFFHTDAAQAFGKIRVDVKDLKVDYLTIVGHKV